MNTACVIVPLALTDLLPIVNSVVAQLGRRLPAHVVLDDLASAGKVALIEATMSDRGLMHEELRAYCYTRVRGAIYDELRRQDPLSREARKGVRLIQRSIGTLEVSLGRAPTHDEVAAATGMEASAVRKIEALANAARALSLDAADLAGGTFVEDTASLSPAHAADSTDLLDALHQAMTRLPPKQAYVLRRVYLEDAEMSEVARELQISLPRVHQLRTSGEKHLKADILLAVFR